MRFLGRAVVALALVGCGIEQAEVESESSTWAAPVAPLPPEAVDPFWWEARVDGTTARVFDYDADGFDDVIAWDEGFVQVYLGSPTGPSVTPSFGIPSAPVVVLSANDVFSHGDLNCDGLDELVIARGDTVEIWNGSDGGVGTVQVVALPDWQWHVETGDANGDGCDDLVTANAWQTYGVVHLLLGSPSGPVLHQRFQGSVEDYSYGWGPVFADVDGDGFDDLIIPQSRFRHDSPIDGAGTVFVHAGGPGGVSAAPVVSWTGAREDFGDAVIGVDLDLDGDDEVVVLDTYLISPAGKWSGFRVYDGHGGFPTSESALWFRTKSLSSLQTTALASADVDGDAYPDVLATAAYEGNLLVYRGGPTLQDAVPWFEGKPFGVTVAYEVELGDLNGDGRLDIVPVSAENPNHIAAATFDTLNAYPGAFPYLTPASGTGDWLGGLSLAVGDVNGDGLSDAVIGAPSRTFSSTQRGVVELYLGKPWGLSTSPVARWVGGTSAGFGTRVAIADVNGDGKGDVIASNPSASNGTNKPVGTVDVYLGTAAGASSTAFVTWTGVHAGHAIGASLAAGELTGDGFADVVTGSASATTGTTVVGRASIFRGAASAPSTTPVVSFAGTSTARLGADLAVADVTGDGRADVVATTRGPSSSFLRSAWVFAGATTWSNTATKQLDTLAGASNSVPTVAAVDLDGDGVAEIVLGGDQPAYENLRLESDLLVGVFDGRASAGTAPVTTWTSSASMRGVPAAAQVAGTAVPELLVGGAGPLDGSLDGPRLEARPYAGGVLGARLWRPAYDVLPTRIGSGDFDGDGALDLIVLSNSCTRSTTGCAYVYVGESGGLSMDPLVPDGDADGADGLVDCDDTNPNRYPGNTEVPADGVDQDCDGRESCYVDADDDGYRTTVIVLGPDATCTAAGEAVASEPTGDCDDTRADTRPGATDIVGTGRDENCDGAETCWFDRDDDGFVDRADGTRVSADLDCLDAFEGYDTDPLDVCWGADASGDPDVDKVCGDLDTCDTLAGEDTDLDGVCGGDTCLGTNSAGDSNRDGVCNGVFKLVVGTVRPGASATLSASLAPKNTNVVFYMSTVGVGTGPCLGSTCANLASPVTIGTVKSSKTGTASITYTVPTSIPAGTLVTFRAITSSQASHYAAVRAVK